MDKINIKELEGVIYSLSVIAGRRRDEVQPHYKQPTYCRVYLHELETIIAGAKAYAAQQWRDIGSYTHDNFNGRFEEVLVSGKAVSPHTGMYVSEAYFTDEGWFTDQGKLKNQPTHWRYKPLPPAPVSEGE